MLRERLLTAPEVAAYLRCSASTVRRLAGRGVIPHYRLGKMVRFRRRELDAWLAGNRVGELPIDPTIPPVDPAQMSLFGDELALA